ncbi:beta-galactosidase [Bifidobacterium eulemuris]|uniref:Beta-galactosidase n=1 Tax=Bifidobacterium eulemuris TaxID=1765219 RepID=A0A261GDF7_9BIFI|nr:beta-galactosidase [Bifidobacterium eulemuris]OZG69458.1 beta-galactosidase [Bifidobacterium eulemuris]QOL32179.1 beta-galactosidase [Bifidobacterium eulemuris]
MQPLFDSFLFGGDWNPEQWPEETWERDIEMLEHAHINEATINVFSWTLLQPDEGEYDFATLDRIVALLVRHKFNIVLATSTAALPAWLVRTHPEVIRTESNGRRHVFGGRHNFCPNSAVFRGLSGELASRIAERYAGTPGLKAWHIGNEYGGGGGMCYCETCAEAFREWLRGKYGTLEALNRAWCANFWSHTIVDWADVVPPVEYGDGIGTEKAVVSGLLMDYRRFQNESQLACYVNERDAVRRHDAATPITTNLMGTFKDLDYFAWGRELDVVSWDNYPGMDMPSSYTAMCHDLMRGVGGGKPFMLMEQTPNQQNWFPFCKVKRPGEVRALSWQAVAHGADTVQFFQMRQSIGGCERFHGAVIAHDGTEDSRVFRETAALGEELERVGARLMGSHTRARVAVMFDWESYWSLEGCVGPTKGFQYPQEVHRFYRALHRRNVEVDVIASTTPAAELKRYALVVAPALIMVKPGVAEALEEYVREGGRFVTGYMAGIHDEHDLVVPGGYPGALREVCGVWVEEIDALAPDETVAVRLGGELGGGQARGEIVASIMHLEGARALAEYDGDDFYADTAALSVNEFGQGRAYYVGTPLDEDGMDAFLGALVAELGVFAFETPEGVEVATRHGDDDTDFVFVLNMTGQARRVLVPVDADSADVLVGDASAAAGVEHELAPYGVEVLAVRCRG